MRRGFASGLVRASLAPVAASAMSALRSFDSIGNIVGTPMPNETADKSNKRMEMQYESAAAGRYAENKPRAIMFVNKRPVEIIPQEENLLEVMEREGIRVPKFCYHPILSVAGNCRMCMVQVDGTQNIIVACATAALPGMSVLTDTRLVRDAREGNVELILVNHPNDCPICEQATNCDLQHIAMNYGTDLPRYREDKHAVNDFYFDPHTRVVLNRCIHCTRCVRFSEEIAGVEDLGVTGRGNAMEIGTYVEKAFDSELSGNVVDICPVGALTSKPYAFTARPWELSTTESIDVMDAVGSNIRVDTRGGALMRILPRLHEDVNEEWLSDKSRHAWDGLTRQRLDTPLVRNGDQYDAVTWPEALRVVQEKLLSVKGHQIKAIVGDQADCESVIALKDFMNRLGSTNTECRQDGAQVSADLRSDYVFNTTIAGLEEADVVLLVGTNPRMEAPLINARIRKAVVQYGTEVLSVGPAADLTYPVQQLGDSGSVLKDILSGKHPAAQKLKDARRAVVIVGTSVTRRADGAKIVESVRSLAQNTPSLLDDGWNGVNVLQLSAGRTGALDLGFVPGPDASDKDVQVVYNLAADEYNDAVIPDNAFVIYQGHHGDKGASRADVILPGSAYTEKDATFVNTEGRVQRTHAALNRVGDAREDWQIIRALSQVTGHTLPYDSVQGVRARMADVAPHMARVDYVEPAVAVPAESSAKDIADKPFSPALSNFFFTDPISRNSRTMARATQELKKAVNSYL